MTPPPTDTNINHLEDFGRRLDALEKRIAPSNTVLPPRSETLVSVACAVLAIYCAARSLGFPTELYQWSIGLALVGLAYHSGHWRLIARPENLILVPLNVVLIGMLTKLLIGAGLRHPFYWLRYPTIQLSGPAEKWYSIIPKTDLAWQSSELASWAVDLTVVQSFLAVICVFTALIRFQPFASLVALLLVLFSIPSLMEFNWPLVFPAMLLSGVAFYLQTPRRRKNISQ